MACGTVSGWSYQKGPKTRKQGSSLRITGQNRTHHTQAVALHLLSWHAVAPSEAASPSESAAYSIPCTPSYPVMSACLPVRGILFLYL